MCHRRADDGHPVHTAAELAILRAAVNAVAAALLPRVVPVLKAVAK